MKYNRLVDEFGNDLGVIAEAQSKDSGDPEFRMYEVYVYAEEPDEPPFDENHYRFHTPNSPVESCDWCNYLNWWRD